MTEQRKERFTAMFELRKKAQAATPGPWQRSFFARNNDNKNWPVKAINEAMQHELRVIRGPGVVGSPACNVVLVAEARNNLDLDFIAAANPEAVIELVDRLEQEIAFSAKAEAELRQVELTYAKCLAVIDSLKGKLAHAAGEIDVLKTAILALKHE